MSLSSRRPEDLVIGPGTVAEFAERAAEVVQAGLRFKMREPMARPVLPPDRAEVHASAMIGREGTELWELVRWLDEVVFRGSLNWGSATFLAHPDCSNSMAAVLGEIATGFLGQNLSSVDYSPVATQLELDLLLQLRGVVGYPLGDEPGCKKAGGGIVNGGSHANFTGLLAAREHLRRRLARDGQEFDPRRTRVIGNRPYTHFSLRRGLMLMGLGNHDLTAEQRQERGLAHDCQQDVATDGLRTDPVDLERQIERILDRGEQVMAIFAVAGDSRFMAFDDLNAVCDVADRYGIWVHVDGCEGGQVLFSPRRRHLMAGVERSHSLSLDPHKVLMVPYTCSAFFLRDPEWLEYFTDDTGLINQGEDSLGRYTPGVNSKSFISLKLLMMLRHWGWEQLAAEVDRRHELAVRAAELLTAHPRLRLINPEVEHNAVVFAYVPADPVDLDRLNAINQALHVRLNTETQYFVHACLARDGHGIVSPDRETVQAMRMMFGNPLSKLEHVRDAFDQIVALGDRAAQE